MKLFKTIIRTSILVLFVLILLPSCTITKMRYSRGISVSFNLIGNSQDNAGLKWKQKHDRRILKSKYLDSSPNRVVAEIQLKDSTVSLLAEEVNIQKETTCCFVKQQTSNIRPKISISKQDHHKKVEPVPSFKKSKGNNTGQVDEKNKPDKTHSGNSWIIALLLCIFFGIIGAHRFYLGYTGIGIIQLLTFGLLGIWTLIDFIRILTGSLKPKDGEYIDY